MTFCEDRTLQSQHEGENGRTRVFLCLGEGRPPAQSVSLLSAIEQNDLGH